MGTRWEVQAILLGVVSLPFVFGRCAGVLWGMSALGWIKPLQNPIQSNPRDHLGNSSVLAHGGSYQEVKEDLLAAFGRQRAEKLSKLTSIKMYQNNDIR